MANLFIRTARRLALRRHAGRTATSIRPLSAVRSAVVLFSASSPGDLSLAGEIRGFFASKSVECHVFALNTGEEPLSAEGVQVIGRKGLNWFGRVRRNRRTPSLQCGEDLFVSLVRSGEFAAVYAARCSNALFKVGCDTSCNDVFDLMVTAPEGVECTQKMIFGTIVYMLEKIR